MIAEPFADIADLLPEPMLLVAGDGRLRGANAAASRLLGVAVADLIGRPVFELLATPEEDVKNYLRNCSRSRQLVIGSLTVRTADGWTNVFRSEGAVLRPRRGGEPSLILLRLRHKDVTSSRFALLNQKIDQLAREIIERKRVEALVDGQRQVLESIAQGAPLADVLTLLVQTVETHSGTGLLGSILLLDEDGVHLRHGAAPNLPEAYNQAIDGLPIGPAVGSCGTAAYRKEQVIVTDIATDPLWEGYRELVLPHGLHACWSAPILSTDGRVLGTFAMYSREPRPPHPRDIQIVSLVTRTAAIAIERSRAEQAVEDQQKWLEAILNLMPTPMVLIEPETARVIFANRAADLLAGGDYPRGGPAEQKQAEFTYTDEAGKPVAGDRTPAVRAARGERLKGLQLDWHTPLGKRALLIFSDTLPAMHGHPPVAVMMFQDITKIKEVEAELQRAGRMKDEFLATVSHELRTPLNAILGWARMLRTGRLDEATYARALEAIERNSKAQAQLVEDLLDVSRIITGQLRLDVQSVDPISFIQAAIDSVKPSADARGIRLQLALDPRAGPVSADPGRLQQVIWNLLSNAIKFTPKGGRVQIRLERANSHIEIIVSDTGRGISKEFLPRVFDRFSQAGRTLSDMTGGLGLGLAIVRHLVEMHGGTVHAHSDGEGKGATFTVKLPLMVVRDAERFAGEPHERIHPASDADAPFICPPALEGLKVLVVDDEPDARELLATILGHCGARVTAVDSAAAALREIGRERPDILVSDIEMPGEDGYALISRIRAGESGGRRLPAIALTAYARVEDRLRALTAGFQTHVAKPVEPAELVAVIASLV